MTPTILEGALLVFVVGCALGTALLEDVLAAIMAFAAYSLGISLIWVLLQAPDVGLTEAAVGAGVMTVLFLLAVAKTAREPTSRLLEPVRWRSVGLVGLFVGTLGLTLGSIPAVGEETAIVADDVSRTYLAESYQATGVENAVTAVLAAYRGLDTLGEAFVVFTAAIAVLAVFGREVLS